MSSDTSARQDRGGLAAPVQGTLYEGRAARTHDETSPLIYAHGVEYRDDSELQRIVDQLPGKPLTLAHPDGMIGDGTPAKVIGHVVSARIEDGHAVVAMMVSDEDGVQAIADGTHELSLGYKCQLDDNKFQRDIQLDHLALVPKGRCQTCALRADEELNAKSRHALSTEEFAVPESRQLPIENEEHVRAAMSRFGQTHFPSTAAKKSAYHKIVAKAHSLGIDCSGFEKEWSGRLDESTSETPTCKCHTIGHNESTNYDLGTKLIMDELQKQLAAALADVAQQKARADQAEKDRDAAVARADKADADKTVAEVDAMNAKKDAESEKIRADKAEVDAKAALEKAHADAASELDARIAARVELLTAATPIVGKSDKGEAVDLLKMSDRDIKIAVIKRVDGDDVSTDGKPDAFVDGVYAGALKRFERAGASRSDARLAINQMRNDGVKPGLKVGLDAEREAQNALRARLAGRKVN